MVKCGSKNRHQKDMCLKEIGLTAQNMFTILGSIVNIIGPGGGEGRIWALNEHESLHFDNDKSYLYELQKLWGKWLQGTTWICQWFHTSCMFHIIQRSGWREVSVNWNCPTVIADCPLSLCCIDAQLDFRRWVVRGLGQTPDNRFVLPGSHVVDNFVYELEHHR